MNPLFVSALLVGLGLFSNAAPAAVDRNQPPKCEVVRSGPLSTIAFEDKSCKNVTKHYHFDTKSFVAFDPDQKHPEIRAEFQKCTPNFAREPNNDKCQQLYGRVYIPCEKKCLVVINPHGDPPYCVTVKECPNDMTAKDAIGFNFVMDSTDGGVDIRWCGGTIPSKKIWQGPAPMAQYTNGQYFVHAANNKDGKNVFAIGEPSSDAGNCRIHLYNPRTKYEGTLYNGFTLPECDPKDPPKDP